MRFDRALATPPFSVDVVDGEATGTTLDADDDGPRACTIVGTAGNDELRGSVLDDVIGGLGGNDRLVGRGGRDVLLGGNGDDVLRGVSGDDRLDGGRGSDILLAGARADALTSLDGAMATTTTTVGPGSTAATPTAATASSAAPDRPQHARFDLESGRSRIDAGLDHQVRPVRCCAWAILPMRAAGAVAHRGTISTTTTPLTTDQGTARTPLEVVQALYAAFGRGDMAGLLDLIDRDADWSLQVNAPGGDLVPMFRNGRGHDAVRSYFEGVAQLEFHVFEPQAFHRNGDEVLVELALDVSHRSTGKRARLAEIHRFIVRDGKVVHYRPYVDTATLIDLFRT